MGKRSTGRRIAMQALYQAETSSSDIETALNHIFESESFIEDTKKFARDLASEAWKERGEADKIISGLSHDWSIDRIAEVDKSILRLAIYELRCTKETPSSVVINEAVELAKKFSGEESSKFVNGVLGGFLKMKKA